MIAELLSILTGIVLGTVTGFVMGRKKAILRQAEKDYEESTKSFPRLRGILKPVKGN